jgi:hypothetical protein
MYVSSFSTFVHSNSAQKIYKQKENADTHNIKNSFNKELSEASFYVKAQKQLPINYISNYKVLNNQQKLQGNKNTQEFTKFSKISAKTNAQKKYEEEMTIFSFSNIPKVALHQTPTINTKLPPEAQTISEQNLRNTMINTYTANESYYQITSVA